MTSPLFSSLEVIGQLIAGIQKTYYTGLSSMVMFLWDYGEFLHPISNRMNPYRVSSPVITFDQEVSPNVPDKRRSMFNMTPGGIYMG